MCWIRIVDEPFFNESVKDVVIASPDDVSYAVFASLICFSILLIFLLIFFSDCYCNSPLKVTNYERSNFAKLLSQLPKLFVMK